MPLDLAAKAAPGNGWSVKAVRQVISGRAITVKPAFAWRRDPRNLPSMSGGKIFISYRRADNQWAATRMNDTLAHAFPNDHIFMDVEDIAPGQDFVDVLARQVDACHVFLALIGPDWLSMTTPAGVRRLDDPDDFVQVEIASALARSETLTIPVLLDGATPLTEDDLPEDLRALARRQFVRLTHERFRPRFRRWSAPFARGSRRLWRRARPTGASPRQSRRLQFWAWADILAGPPPTRRPTPA